uniref:Uncharacterized protein n=1 Tax=Rhizophagus irregularis (strain DAOM 181602 / DAOM 197198 / MUCL 43194) TaxID=747089 RepID=U9TBQ0_RHIID
MSEILYVESFQFLLQKFGNWLENFGFGFMNDDYNGPRRQLLKLIMKYYIWCGMKEFITEKKRVKYLAISEFGPGVDNELFSSKDKFKFHNVVNRTKKETEKDFKINNRIATVIDLLCQIADCNHCTILNGRK